MSEEPIRYCGREFTTSDLMQIRRMLLDHPMANRAQLSRMVCEALGWSRLDGRPKEMSCRVAMLRMHDDGLLSLPPPRKPSPNDRPCRRRTPQADPGPLVVAHSPKALQNLHLEIVTQLRYFVRTGETVVALLGFGAATWKTKPRDSFIGWTPERRQRNLQLVIDNARFLILPWVQCKNLASHILGLVSRTVPLDWYRRYGYRLVLVETFVEIPRFRGTCYKAANWTCLGTTQGRGKVQAANSTFTTTPSFPRRSSGSLPWTDASGRSSQRHDPQTAGSGAAPHRAAKAAWTS